MSFCDFPPHFLINEPPYPNIYLVLSFILISGNPLRSVSYLKFLSMEITHHPQSCHGTSDPLSAREIIIVISSLVQLTNVF